MSLQSIDLSKKVPQPTLWLSKPNKLLIGKLDKYIYNIAHKARLRDTDELSFTVPFEISARGELKRNPNIDKIKINYLIKFVYNGSTEWYKVTKITKSSNDKDELLVTAMSLEFELSQKKIINYSVKSYNCTQVLTDILNGTKWSILSVDSSFDQSFRDFEFSSKSSLDALLNDVTSTFKGSIVTFDTDNRKISVVKESSIGQDRGLRIVYSQYMTDINEETSSDQIVTRLYAYGKDNLGIERVNSNGLPYVQDFSYYTNSDYMTDSLITAVNNYNTLLNSKAPIDDVAETGTTTTNVTMTAHGLTVGSYIVNRSRNRATRKVLTVVDSNNITISSISGQNVNDTILKYPLTSFGKLLFEKEDLQADLTTKTNELDTLKLNKLTVLDRVAVQLQAKTIDTYSTTISNTSLTRTLTGINSADKFAAMVKISSTVGTTVTINGSPFTFAANAWTLGKITGLNSHSIVTTTTGTNITVKTLIVKITESEYSTSGNESVLIDTYSEDYKQSLIDSKQSEINTINTNITSKDAEITTMKNSLSMTTNFTTAQLDELKDFIYEDEFRDDNLIDDKDLYDVSVEEIKERNSPQVLYKTGVVDFLSSITEQRNWKKLNLGDTVNAAHKKLKIDIKTKITEIERDFENKSVNITIASNKDVLSIQSRAIKSLYKSVETTNNLNAKKADWNNTKTNFTKRNDRISVNPANPTILSDSTAIDHVVNDDGSVDISFEWSYTGTGDAYDIDGFTIYSYSSPTDIRYVFGSTIANEQTYNATPDKRAFLLQSVPSNKYFYFGIQAYRVVDEDVNSNGILKSDIVQPSLAAENPYRPESNVAFAGNITGTVNGIAASTVTSQSGNGQTAFTGTTTYRDTTVPNGTFTPSNLTHTANTDGSVDITIQWTFTQGSVRADGFMLVYEKGLNVVPTSASPTYTQDLTTTKMVLSGVAADLYHNFKIYAYRTTNTGIVISTLTNGANWLNYQPATVPNFTGNIGGKLYDEISKSSATFIVADGSTSGNTKRADYVVPAGSTSAHTTINNAINALPATGGKIVLLDGTFTIDGEILGKSNVELEGQGDSTIIKLKNNHNTDIIMIRTISGSITNFKIKNIKVDGNKSNQTGGYQYGIYLNNVSNSFVTYCTVQNCSNSSALYIGVDSNSNTITDNYIYNNNYGIEMNGFLSTIRSKNNVVTRNKCISNYVGISVASGIKNIISLNICENNTLDGIQINQNLAGSSNIISTNNCNGNDFGIRILLSDNVDISDNLCSENRKHGIYGFGNASGKLKNCTIQGNRCINNSQESDNLYDNIHLDFDADYNTVQSNTCRKGNFIIHSGTAQIGSTSTTIILSSSASSTDSQYNNRRIYITSGTGVGQNRKITTYVGSTKTATVDSAWVTTPDTTSVYEIKSYTRYGIRINSVDCDNNTVINNDLYDSGSTGGFSDAGTSTNTGLSTVNNRT